MEHLAVYLLVAAVLFVGLALAAFDPLIIAMLAVPGVLIVHRVGGASLNLSGSDVSTVIAVAVALPMLRADMRTTRRLLGIAVLFQAVLLLTVVAHPNSKSIFEWSHRFVLVGGSIAIGTVLGRAGRASAAVTLFLGSASALSVAAIATSLAHGFEPAYPFGMQKNFVGGMAASAVVIAVLKPAWLRLSRNALVSIALLCAAGLLASQSRGAMLALGAAIFVAFVREGRLSRRSIISVLVVTPLVVFAVASVRQEAGQHHINSLTYRADYSALAYREWHMSPFLGQGLRFFEEPGALMKTDAHNVVASTLAESGVVGLAALAISLAAALFALWQLPAEVAAVAVALVVERFVHGLFDVYWVAGSSTLPWLIVGVVCGTCDAGASQPARPAVALRTLHGVGRR